MSSILDVFDVFCMWFNPFLAIERDTEYQHASNCSQYFLLYISML